MSVEPIPAPADLAAADPGGLLTPRHDLAAEQSVLGAVMLSAEQLDTVAGVLRASDFYRPAHQVIWETILDLWGRGERVDAVTVGAALISRGLIDRAGGGGYLRDLLAAPPVASAAATYAKIVRDCAKLRALAMVGTRLWQAGMEGDPADVDDCLARAHEDLVNVSEPGGGEDIPAFGADVVRALDRLERGEDRSRWVPAPYADLDALLGGFRPGQVITVAARPSVGKSQMATDIARHAAIGHGRTVFLASVEMTRDEITDRIMAAESRIPLDHIRNGTLSEDEWARIGETSNRISTAPLLIDDRPHVTLTTLRAALRKAQRRTDVPPPSLLIVDYLQLLQATSKAENRQVEVSELSRGLKLIAKEFGIPVVSLSQLNRAPEARADKRPMVSDLRESGSIEQDSDVVILIHREDMYDSESPRAGEADLIVAKNRNGRRGTVVVVFQGHYSRFVDMARTP